MRGALGRRQRKNDGRVTKSCQFHSWAETLNQQQNPFPLLTADRPGEALEELCVNEPQSSVALLAINEVLEAAAGLQIKKRSVKSHGAFAI